MPEETKRKQVVVHIGYDDDELMKRVDRYGQERLPGVKSRAAWIRQLLEIALSGIESEDEDHG